MGELRDQTKKSLSELAGFALVHCLLSRFVFFQYESAIVCIA